jgi:biopolymer transport protein TolQ
MSSILAGLQAAQSSQPIADRPLDLILGATPVTLVILAVLAGFSLFSWILIFWKWREFKSVQISGDEFVQGMGSAAGLRDIVDGLGQLDESPYTRVFRRGVSFFAELRPTALRSEAPPEPGLSSAQLDTLLLVLEKELSEERDELAHGLPWLAIIGSISPLLGLMGTVMGVMTSFIGITTSGTANIAAVAPGIAEALVTTVAGLGVAIPAVIAYNHYAAKLGLFTGELEGFAAEFIGTLGSEGRI